MAFLAANDRFQTRYTSLGELEEKGYPVQSTDTSLDSLMLLKVINFVSEANLDITHNNRILGIIESEKLLAILKTRKTTNLGLGISNALRAILRLNEAANIHHLKLNA